MAQFQFSAGGLTVYEGATAFYVTNGHKEVCIGDGVDMFASMSGSGKSLMVGTPAFYTAMRRWLSQCADEIAEAYGL